MLKIDSLIKTASKGIIIVMKLGNIPRATFAKGSYMYVNMADKVKHFPQKLTENSKFECHCNLRFWILA